MEVNVKDARTKIRDLLDKTEAGQEITIVRRGKKVARLVPMENHGKKLPDLSDFRDSISVKERTLSDTVIDTRNEERY